MTAETTTRRSFLKVGALIAAPLAAAPAVAADGAAARLKRLEDEAALRDLHRGWLREFNAAAGDAALDPMVRSIAADDETFAFAADGRSATARFRCAVEIETELAQDCTLAQMAHAQGDGFVRRSETRILAADYVRTGDGWAIASLALATA